jgi:4-hydroxy-tetrahydrodipicolinate synthase
MSQGSATDAGAGTPTTVRAALSGLFAALTTPFTQSGAVDYNTFDRHLDLLLDAGIDGICLSGATAEYPHVETADRRALIARAAQRLGGRSTLLVAIGGPTIHHTVALGHCALDHGSRAVLLPMPMFFRYQPGDLYAICADVARQLAAPCLLYDLPDFTNPLDTTTILALLEHEPHIAGIKDSSGRVERFAQLAAARRDRDWALVVGSDARVRDAIGVHGAGWDASVSGLASVCPELLVSLVRAAKAGDVDETIRLQALVDELIAQVMVMPVPWGLRLAAEARGLPLGPLPWPMSAQRREQGTELQRWMPSWLERVGVGLWTR